MLTDKLLHPILIYLCAVSDLHSIEQIVLLVLVRANRSVIES